MYVKHGKSRNFHIWLPLTNRILEQELGGWDTGGLPTMFVTVCYTSSVQIKFIISSNIIIT